MAKIEQVVSSPSSASANTQPEQSAAKNKKRKLKEIQASAAGAGSDNDNDRSTEADSPTIKFKKLATPKANKRKVKSTPSDATKAPKQNKREHAPMDADEEDDKADDNDAPTAAELSAADRPENTPQLPTTRQKKRDKHAKVQLTAKVDAAQREQLRNRDYLLQWRDRRADWKFNKLRQISVSKSLFREAGAADGSGEQQLDDEMWRVAMEYLCGTKGQLRQLLRDAAQKVIDEVDGRIMREGNAAVLVQQVNYTRAREFLQMME